MEINIKRTAGILITVALMLTFLHTLNRALGNPYWNWTLLIDLDREANLPTWYSSMLWAFASLLALCCYHTSKIHNLISVTIWKWTSLLFLFASLDEAAQIHEKLENITNHYLLKFPESDGLNWSFYFGASVLILIGIFLILLIYNSKENPQAYLLIAFGIILSTGGAVVFEYLSNVILKTTAAFQNLEIIAEELLEMMGVIIIIAGLLSFLKKEGQSVFNIKIQ